LGGDWNATFSNLPLEINPDVFSMRGRTKHGTDPSYFAAL